MSSGKDFSEGKWRNQVPSTAFYSHAIWWESPVGVPANNPTVSFAGMIIRVEATGLSQQTEGILQTAIEAFSMRQR